MFKTTFNLIKYPLLFVSGGVAHHFYEENKHNKSYKDMKTKLFKKQIEEDQLKHPKLYNTYMKVNQFD